VDTNNLQPYDKLIDSALRSEPDRPVPEGFRGRVMERVAVEAASPSLATDRTQRTVRMTVVLGLLAAAFVVVPMAAFYGQWTRQTLPGGMGAMDYAFAWMDLARFATFTDLTMVGTIAAVAMLAGTLAAGFGYSRLRRVRD